MTFAQIVSWLVSAISFGTVIMYGCIGETIDQKAGGLNLGVPGVMQIGGIAALASAFLYEYNVASPNPWIALLLCLLSTLIASALAGLLYSFLTVTLKVNQNVTGLTLTIFGTGIANFFGGNMMKLSGGVGTIYVATTSNAFRAKLPLLSSSNHPVAMILFSHGWMVYLALILAFVAHYFLNRTRTGLNLRSVGENPATADAAGINVTRYKYLASIIGCMICGLGGLFYVMDYIKGTWANDSAIEALGWLAVSLVIFTSWKPKNATWGAYLFGLFYWAYVYIPADISRYLANKMNLQKITYMQNLYKMLPYILTIVVLCFVSHRKRRENQAPASLGQSYFREER